MNYKMAVFDIEGCLTLVPTVWEIMHVKNGTWESHGAPYWQSYLDGEMPYDQFARLDVAAWSGAHKTLLVESAQEVNLMPGCISLIKFLKSNDIKIVLVSNGLMTLAERFLDLGVDDVYANEAITDGQELTGDIKINVPFHGKGQVVKKLMCKYNLAQEEVIAAGDGRADIHMFAKAGRSIAICPAHPHVKEAATDVIESENLELCIQLLSTA